MELLEGKDLGDILRKEGAQAIEVAVEYALQACEALGTAHASGIVHRDVKPDNLFLAKRPQGSDLIKVLDFGISKVAIPDGTLGRQTTMAIGSPHYMSPEQVRATDEVDARADIWSLGCVLYELLTGTPAFDGASLMQISAAILEATPRPMRSIYPYIPEELEAVVQKCLEKDPGRRFQDVGMLAEALVPFAPPRAHIWAERCSHMLAAAGRGSSESGPESTRVSERPTLSAPKMLDTQPISTAAVSMSRSDRLPPRRAPRSRGLLLVLLAAGVALVGYSFSGGTTANVESARGEPEVMPPAVSSSAAEFVGKPADAVKPAEAHPVSPALVPSSVDSAASAEMAASDAAAPGEPVASARAKARSKPKSQLQWLGVKPRVLASSAPSAESPKPEAAPAPAAVIEDELDVGF
jgi:serine/threonine-protein kinase